eukprot:404478-Rhodomonas_salina.3
MRAGSTIRSVSTGQRAEVETRTVTAWRYNLRQYWTSHSKVGQYRISHSEAGQHQISHSKGAGGRYGPA